MRNLNYIDKLANFYIILLIAGFLFIGTVPMILGMTETSIAVPYRIFVLVYSLFLIFSTILKQKFSKQYLSVFGLFFVFWIFYSARIIYDLYINPIKLYPDNGPSYYLQFAFGVVLIPSIAIICVIYTYRINLSLVLKWTYRLLLLLLLVLLYYRANSDFSGRDIGDVSIGILFFGQYGTMLSVLSIYYLSITQFKFKKLIYIVGFITGFLAIVVSASKSPFLALIIVMLVFILLHYGSIKSFLLIALGGALFFYFFIDIISFVNQYFNSNFLDRLFYAIEMGQDEARNKLMSAGISAFIDHPLFGNAMLIQKRGMEGSYPHNLIIESFMATGIVGGSIFLFWFIKCIKLSIKVIRKNSDLSWIALLFIQFAIFGMFSKNLYSNDLFWLFSLILVGIYAKNKTYFQLLKNKEKKQA